MQMPIHDFKKLILSSAQLIEDSTPEQTWRHYLEIVNSFTYLSCQTVATGASNPEIQCGIVC